MSNNRAAVVVPPSIPILVALWCSIALQFPGSLALQWVLFPLLFVELLCDATQLLTQLRLLLPAELLLRLSLPYRAAWLLIPGSYTAVIYASTMNQLSYVLTERQKYIEALAVNRANIALLESRCGRNSMEVASELICRAYILNYCDSASDDAEWAGERALNIIHEAQGKSPKDRMFVASALNNLAHTYINSGKKEKALELFRESLALKEASCAKDGPEVAGAYANIGYTLLQGGCYPEAEPYCRRAVELAQRNHAQDLERSTFMNNLGEVLRRQGKLPEAEPLLMEALKVRERALSRSHPHLAFSYHNVANLMVDKGLLLEAEDFFERAMEIRSVCPGINHSDLHQTISDFASLLQRIGREHEADALLDVHQLRKITKGETPEVA